MKRSDIYKVGLILLLCSTTVMFSCNNKAQSGSSGTIENTVLNENSSGPEKALQQPDASVKNVSPDDEWPGFHGSDRQNKSNETGLMKAWPDDGPELIWTVEGLGEGYASVSIADGLIFTSGSVEDRTYVFAYDLNGKLIWKQPNGSSWKVQVSWASAYNGSRSTPTYDNGVVYHLSEAGRLTAYDAKTGNETWFRDLVKDFRAAMPDYGFTESVLIEGNKLYVKPAGKEGFQVCLDKTTGKTIWINNEIPGTYAYNSPVTTDFGGYHQLIAASSNCYYGIDTETGRLLWKVDFENMHEVNCTDAVVYNDYVLMSNGLGGGSKLVRLKTSGTKITAEKVWQIELMDNYHGGIVYHDGYFYGSGDRSRGWFSIELLTGKQMWKASNSMGSLTYADGMLYLYDEKGVMKLVKATPETYQLSGEFKVPKGGSGPYWAHPVVFGGRLYIRHADKLFAYNVSI